MQASEDDEGNLRWDSYAKNIDDVVDIDNVDDTLDGGDNTTSKTHTDNQNTQYPFRGAVYVRIPAAGAMKPPKVKDSKNKSVKKK